MDNQQLAALIAAFIVAHGAATATALWKGVQYGVKRLVEWERLLARVDALERELEKQKSDQGAINEKLTKDVNAAFSKIRA